MLLQTIVLIKKKLYIKYRSQRHFFVNLLKSSGSPNQLQCFKVQIVILHQSLINMIFIFFFLLAFCQWKRKYGNLKDKWQGQKSIEHEEKPSALITERIFKQNHPLCLLIDKKNYLIRQQTYTWQMSSGGLNTKESTEKINKNSDKTIFNQIPKPIEMNFLDIASIFNSEDTNSIIKIHEKHSAHQISQDSYISLLTSPQFKSNEINEVSDSITQLHNQEIMEVYQRRKNQFKDYQEKNNLDKKLTPTTRVDFIENMEEENLSSSIYQGSSQDTFTKETAKSMDKKRKYKAFLTTMKRQILLYIEIYYPDLENEQLSLFKEDLKKSNRKEFAQFIYDSEMFPIIGGLFNSKFILRESRNSATKAQNRREFIKKYKLLLKSFSMKKILNLSC